MLVSCLKSMRVRCSVALMNSVVSTTSSATTSAPQRHGARASRARQRHAASVVANTRPAANATQTMRFSVSRADTSSRMNMMTTAAIERGCAPKPTGTGASSSGSKGMTITM